MAQEVLPSLPPPQGWKKRAASCKVSVAEASRQKMGKATHVNPQ